MAVVGDVKQTSIEQTNLFGMLPPDRPAEACRSGVEAQEQCEQDSESQERKLAEHESLSYASLEAFVAGR